MKKVYYTRDVRPEKVYEKECTEDIVERTGHVDNKTLIERMFLAGRGLMVAKEAYFNYGPEDEVPDDAAPEPTADPAFDEFAAADLAKRSIEVLTEETNAVDNGGVPDDNVKPGAPDNDSDNSGKDAVEGQ